MESSMSVMKYFFPPFVNTPFISQRSECISSNGAKFLTSAVLWDLRGCLAWTHTWHLEPFTVVNFGIKLIFANRVMQPKLIWQSRECQTLESSSWQTWLITLVHKSDKDRRNKPPHSLPFSNKLSILRNIGQRIVFNYAKLVQQFSNIFLLREEYIPWMLGHSNA